MTAISYLVLAQCFLDGPEVAGLVVAGIPVALAAGDFSQATLMLVWAGRFATNVAAAWQLRAYRPWARWWLVCVSLPVVVFSPLYLGDVMQSLGGLFEGGARSFGAARLLAQRLLPFVVLVVLMRPRRDFRPIGMRERALVVTGIALLLLAIEQNRPARRERPSPSPTPLGR